MSKTKIKTKPAVSHPPNGQKSSLQKQIDDLSLKWKRALADYHNLEKRIEAEKEALTKFLNAGLIEKLLVITDDLERASIHIKDRGLAIILNKLTDVLRAEWLQEIKVEDQPFDPETMDCIDLVRGSNNQVINVVQKGYWLHGRVLRPAKVKVGKGGRDKIS
jgi:molecular chaperone GrpE